MDKIYKLIFLALISLALISPASSNANGENPPSHHAAPRRHSAWKRSSDLVNGHISRTKLVSMQDMTDDMIIYLQDSCATEDNRSATWHAEFISDKSPMMKFGVQCNFSEKASLRIMANEIDPLMDHLVVNGAEYVTLKPIAGQKSENAYFEYRPDEGSADASNTADDGSHLQTKAWLVASDAKNLPFTAVSRREYLKEAIAELEKIKAGITAKVKAVTPIRSQTEQESEKKAILDQLNASYAGIELRVRVNAFLAKYKTDEAYQAEKIKEATASQDETIHRMQDLLAHLSSPALGKPAIVSVQASDFQGFEDGQPGANMLVHLNPSSFDGGAGGEKPKFFLVRWTYEPSNPMVADLDQLITEKLDFRVLKDFLKK
jgi:hypothetical protein